MTYRDRLPGRSESAWLWQMDAACRGMASSVFFHPWNERGPTRQEREERAKAVCAGCPVIEECRAHAISVREHYGVWGGLTEDERARLILRSSGRVDDATGGQPVRKHCVTTVIE